MHANTADQPTTQDPTGAEGTLGLQTTWHIWLLISVGVILYLVADGLGISAVARVEGNGRSWNPDHAREAELSIRGFAAILIAAGFVERIVHAIHSLRR